MTTQTVNNRSAEAAAEYFANKLKLVETKLQEQSANMEQLMDCLRSLSLSTTYSENIAKMASSITHEVRNPLTSVSGFLQLIKQTNNLDTIHQYTDLAFGELTRANELITDFLNLSKAQSNEITPLSINEILMNLYPVFKSEANLKDIDLNINLSKAEPFCIANKQHLTQVIVNVVKNAFEAIEEDNKLTFKKVIITTEVSMNQLLVIVKDSGCGISEDQFNHIFSPLKTTKKKGTGMGLYVCKQLIEKYGGEINIESTAANGTTIFISLPSYISSSK
ncbi:HAMP domain-containing sensor histidine kinase [Niallia sp.]|uniref:two-component system sensor histidine kinase NtrB n=1 Tax=Niallia sp. TaxID=2837523 RepID=UPI00289BE09B|nr:HAMP domain-containing sensor histidine kinase [Niallia sp.]